MSNQISDAVYGAVVIGRNEGERLKNCLLSVTKSTRKLVYVDSGSTDGSIEFARGLGVEVVELDPKIPFTAARARNLGFKKICAITPEIKYVQFIDGDCEMLENWLGSAVSFLAQNKTVAVVCGRRRERFPTKSIYNLLCDKEWDTALGEAKFCGGDAMMNVDAFIEAGGFKDDLIAGEEPELCLRLRRQGWKIWRLDRDMTLHDAAMLKFSQWWKRNFRAGHAFAQGACLHGGMPERHWVRETQSALFWGLALPLITLLLTYFLSLWALLLLAAYPLQVVRLANAGDYSLPVNIICACFMVLGKFPETLGILKFFISRAFNSGHSLIEYK